MNKNCAVPNIAVNSIKNIDISLNSNDNRIIDKIAKQIIIILKISVLFKVLEDAAIAIDINTSTTEHIKKILAEVTPSPASLSSFNFL